MENTILCAENLSKEFIVGEQRIGVLDDVSFAVDKGQFVIISGTSGSGKSTLLGLLSGLDKPSHGRVEIDGIDITSLSEDQIAPVRNRLTGFVFQSFHLIPSLNALENIMFPAELKGEKNSAEKASDLLSKVGMSHRMNSFPSQLSGGEQQRIAICRALINNPKIVFADEPTGNLDSENSEAIVALLREFSEELDTTLLVATHSSSLARQADRIIHLHDGHIISGAVS